MACDVLAIQNGAPCVGDLRSGIDRRVAQLEAGGMKLDACRVVMDTHKRHASGSYVFVLLEIKPEGARRFLPSHHAIESSEEAALDTVFAIAQKALHQPDGGEQLQSTPLRCHIVALAPDGRSGRVEADDGRTLAFTAANDAAELAQEMRVGDRAWLARQSTQDPASLVICGRRGHTTTVRLNSLG